MTWRQCYNASKNIENDDLKSKRTKGPHRENAFLEEKNKIKTSRDYFTPS